MLAGLSLESSMSFAATTENTTKTKIQIENKRNEIEQERRKLGLIQQTQVSKYKTYKMRKARKRGRRDVSSMMRR